MKSYNKNMENGYNKLKKLIKNHELIRHAPTKLTDIKTFYLPIKK